MDPAVESLPVAQPIRVLVVDDSRVIRRLVLAGLPDGALFLGAGETTVGFEQAFVPVLIGRSYVYRLRRDERTIDEDPGRG
jgi:hypothetical protein